MLYNKSRQYFALLTIFTLITACTSIPNNKPHQNPDIYTQKPVDQDILSGNAANITAIRLEVNKPFPKGRINLHIQGSLPDGCTHIDRITQQQKKNIFHIRIVTRRTPQHFCTQAIVPFEKIIMLNTEALPSGTYRVNVHDLNARFAIGPRSNNILFQEIIE